MLDRRAMPLHLRSHRKRHRRRTIIIATATLQFWKRQQRAVFSCCQQRHACTKSDGYDKLQADTCYVYSCSPLHLCLSYEHTTMCDLLRGVVHYWSSIRCALCTLSSSKLASITTLLDEQYNAMLQLHACGGVPCRDLHRRAAQRMQLRDTTARAIASNTRGKMFQ